MTKTKISSAYKVIFAVTIFLGVLDRAGLFSPVQQFHTLYSFTTISNVCVMAILLFGVLKHEKYSSTHPKFVRLYYLCVVMILITGIVYHFVLLPEKIAENPNYQVLRFGNIIAHYIAPIGMLIDWLFFSAKGLVSKREPLLCVSVPLIYFVITTMYGYFGSTIPGKESSYVYFFMDIGKLGVLGVAKWVFAILIFVFVLAYSIYGIDVLLANKRGCDENSLYK